MRVHWLTWVLYGSWSVNSVSAQMVDPRVMNEVAAVRMNVLRSTAALREYTWSEHTEVLLKGKVKWSTGLACGYDSSGELVKKRLIEATEQKSASTTSNRPTVRKKADMEDYIDRAINLTHGYVPLNPERIQYMLEHGQMLVERVRGGESEIRLKDYFQDGDSLVFTYDSVSKELLRVRIMSTLGSPKDPVTLEAAFETLPDGVNHLASTVLNAKARNVQVKTKNVMYRKVPN